MSTLILDFIHRRFPQDSNWLNGNCYWFAYILTTQFGGEICYMPITGHFIALIQGKYYDWTGIILPNEPVYTMEYYRKEEPSLYGRLLHDCKD